jgi:8-oxo-dGTP pyrophosphatase MutT (NUDIX family)
LKTTRYSKTDKREDRAGIIVLKKFKEIYKVLCLRVYGSYDLPKGGVEDGEDIITAAMRETEEECGITSLHFEWGLVTTKVRNVTLYIAVTDQEPIILPNPETGQYEHHGSKWMSLNAASYKLHPYLRPTMMWAKEVIGANNVCIY